MSGAGDGRTKRSRDGRHRLVMDGPIGGRRFQRVSTALWWLLVWVPLGVVILAELGPAFGLFPDRQSYWGVRLWALRELLSDYVHGLAQWLPVLIPLLLIGFGIHLWLKQQGTAAPAEADIRDAHAAGAGENERAAALGKLDLDDDIALKAEVIALEGVRAALAQTIRTRMMICVPLGLVAGLAIGTAVALLPGKNRYPPIAYVLMSAMAGLVGGYVYANSEDRRRAYARAFKERIMPHWLARYGTLSYGPGRVPDLTRLGALGLLPGHKKARAEDEIAGTYRGHSLGMNEVTLIGPPRNKNPEPVVFRGLVAEIAVRRPYRSSTAVIENSLATRLRALIEGTMQPIGLGQTAFEAVYRVYGTDQVAARAVLTPTVMERLITVSHGHGFETPFLLTEGERIALVFPYLEETNLFEPPDLTGHNVVQQLALQHQELDEIFALLDAIIDTQILERSA